MGLAISMEAENGDRKSRLSVESKAMKLGPDGGYDL